MNRDIVIVGGGIGGCALATRLATAGLEVTVLEREPIYRDMVRGEALMPWGFLEAVELGVADAILEADGMSVITRMVPYDEAFSVETAQRFSNDLSSAVPGSPGVIGVGHPELREALAAAASKAGATVVRGVQRTAIELGAEPSVTYEADGETHSLRCRLVVGADGKTSNTRAALGVALYTTHPRVKLSGMLVDDNGVWDRSVTTIAIDGRNQFIVIPRADNRLRMYVGRGVSDPVPIKGRNAIPEFLESYRTPIFPDHDALAESTAIGPCATFPMNDAWTSETVVPGAALIGDAAGWSNPVTAQGLSVTLRDARVLAESLLDNREWTPRSLAGYTEERQGRMARLRFASALTDLLAGFGATDRAARRSRMRGALREHPELGAALAVVHSGPWTAPPDAFSADILTTLALT